LRAFTANQSSNAATSFEFLVFGFEFNGSEREGGEEIKI
jgi:hypothetical protein